MGSSSSLKERLTKGLPLILSSYLLVAIAYAYFAYDASQHVEVPLKTIDTFEEFYPFYISQHQEPTCRRLHVVGITLVIALALYNIVCVPAILIGIIAGLQVYYVTRHLATGLAEFICMFFIYGVTVGVITKSPIKPFLPLVIGYGCAWVGHFFFELNKPATFTYPTFSLIGDFKMWYETATLQREF
jgi:hypothetical protein